ncbi:hypothetical protein Aab01nite_21010 [Paractinoplanes abujensis]|uniref:Peptidoglycan/xylan/chitin deacetylase (PgdA/CDA1 family) n=1 Tax=Paractinoplanes abujensis TaxID=882441 RepID=A0A7W7G635_9ACTN|nr:polysaccharide deacetylase family protein [Actinoplanes abujensis]MBB4697015.1 peptidoglycan/xylan/chitin deacetylase (PgdA/CDA1 family) [Actinoplanes abujensis]GID18511.1 hypothetical protein Aab01nite_21010 [Actinoplanes abujensis]
MSPHSPRIPAQGGASASSGRHRRPESLADVSTGGIPRVSVTTLTDSPISQRSRSARHQRPARTGRHAAARVPAQRPPSGRPPVTGSHRAPGTLPIESWLLMGKKRQQAMLASLVAIGIVLLAMPAEQRRGGFEAVNAAAQAVAGVQTEKKPEQEPQAAPEREQQSAPDKQEQDGTPAKPAAPEPVTPTPAPSTPTAEATAAGPKKPSSDLGPGRSLRTTGSKVVALTFDDGPDPVQTPKILELLAEHQVKATFCLVGTQVERHPEIVRQIVADGHTLCNHTWDHSLKIGKDQPAKIKADLDRTNAAILAAVPGAQIPFFRAPGGNFTERLVNVAAIGGMTSLYWEVDPRDWEHPENETEPQHIARMVRDIQKQVRPGAIVLSHDFNQPATIKAYEKLLPWLTDNFTLGIPGEKAEPETPPAPQPSVTPPADS